MIRKTHLLKGLCNIKMNFTLEQVVFWNEFIKYHRNGIIGIKHSIKAKYNYRCLERFLRKFQPPEREQDPDDRCSLMNWVISYFALYVDLVWSTRSELILAPKRTMELLRMQSRTFNLQKTFGLFKIGSLSAKIEFLTWRSRNSWFAVPLFEQKILKIHWFLWHRAKISI